MSGVLEVTILGCGSSGGVPRADGEWGACDPADPRNLRSRCSLLIRRRGEGGPEHETTVVVDTSPDFRLQSAGAGVKRLDAVLLTHDHADQVHGIDDLRPYTFRTGAIEAWADRRTLGVLRRRFDYVFATESIYHALYRVREIDGPFTAAGTVAVTPIPPGFSFTACPAPGLPATPSARACAAASIARMMVSWIFTAA